MQPIFAVALVSSLAWLPLSVAQTTYCSATVPCAIGCCGQYNVCGLGPDYCGPGNCINNCNATAECNPGGWPAQYVSSETCPLNVCCSPYGFCGTTTEFCGNSTVTRPSCDVGTQSITRVIGYYASGGATRPCNSMQPLSFPQGVYTHIYFAFGSINPDTFEVIPTLDSDEQLYTQLATLQTRDSGQVLWLSIGGWDFTDSGEPTATTFSDLAAAPITQQNVFFASLTLFMATWGFTGVDIDWEYPAASDRNGQPEDYANYPVFLANLRASLNEYSFGLSITLPTSYWYLQHFDLVAIEPSVDWFNYMSYDLHGTWDIGDPWTGAFLDAHTNLTEIVEDLDLLWRNNITASKVNLGLAFYGRSFTLASSSCSEPGCPYLSAGDPGECSATAGILINSEIGQIIDENGLTPTLYSDAAVKVITWNGDQWVSFDDQDTWSIKTNFAKSECLGGVMVWSVDYDDYNHTYSNGLAAALGNPVNVDTSTGLSLTLADTSSQNPQDQYCRFINCGEICPSGFTTISRADETSQLMLDSTECLPASGQTQTLCCPTSTDIPVCQWRGFHNSGYCQPGCNSDEAEVGSTSAGCSSGYQSACCTITSSTAPWTSCQWTTGCESDNTCPSGYSNFVVGSRDGWGGFPSCTQGTSYNYCCSGSIPDAFTNCAWNGHVVPLAWSQLCSDACPAGQIRIAEEAISTFWAGTNIANTPDCSIGNEAYCCAGPPGLNPRGPNPASPQTQDGLEFESLLESFFAAPTCPSGWEDQYSATFSLAARDLNLRQSVDNASSLTMLLQMLAALVTSQYPRQDLCGIWDYQLGQNGYGSLGANCSELSQALCGPTWNGFTSLSPYTLLSDVLCNIAESASGVNNLEAASSALCQLNTASSSSAVDITSSEFSVRSLSEVNMNDRSADGTQPTIAAVIHGIQSGALSLHYARWLSSSSGSQVLLELAFWIGNTPGVTPAASVLSAYSDTTHTVQPDHWVVIHFHIPIDSNTFLQSEIPNFYPGVSALTFYHSQTYRTPGAVTPGYPVDRRAESRFSNSYSRVFNTGILQNYNARAEALHCPLNNAGTNGRWYVGLDRSAEIEAQTGSTAFAELLNGFGYWLYYDEEVFGNADLARIWPAIGNAGPLPAGWNGVNGYNPIAGAFDTNWLPAQAIPQDLANAQGVVSTTSAL